MSADLIVIPFRKPHHARKRCLADLRQVPLAYQPQPLTQPGAVNAYDLTQLVVQRDGEDCVIGRFQTARDAIAAAQSRLIAEEIANLDRTDLAEMGRRVVAILEEHGR